MSNSQNFPGRRLQKWRAYARRPRLRQKSRSRSRGAPEDHHTKGEIRPGCRRAQRPHGRGNSRRIVARRSSVPSTGRRTCIGAPGSRSDLSARSSGCWRCSITLSCLLSLPASMLRTSPTAIAFFMETRPSPSSMPETTSGVLKRFRHRRCRTAPPPHPQGARCGDSNSSRSALARGRDAG